MITQQLIRQRMGCFFVGNILFLGNTGLFPENLSNPVVHKSDIVHTLVNKLLTNCELNGSPMVITMVTSYIMSVIIN